MRSYSLLFLLIVTSLMLMSGSAYAVVVGQWDFDENTGLTANDSSGNNNHRLIRPMLTWRAFFRNRAATQHASL